MGDVERPDIEEKLILEFSFKEDGPGSIEAVVAEYGTVDVHKDIITSGAMDHAFGKQLPLVEKHNGNMIPFAYGVLGRDGDKVMFKAEFMETWRGQDARAALKQQKENGIKQELSIGLLYGTSRYGSSLTEAEKNAGARRALDKIDPFHVSLVDRGAQLGTGILEVKGADEDDDVAGKALINRSKVAVAAGTYVMNRVGRVLARGTTAKE